MRTPLDCLPCFLRQAVRAAAIVAPDNPEAMRKIVVGTAALMEQWDLALPPPEHAVSIHAFVRSVTGLSDIFVSEKRAANLRVLELLPRLRALVAESVNPLRTALEISIVGNYIDCGAPHGFNWEDALAREEHDLNSDDFEHFSTRLRPGATVLILGDNAGEIGLDLLLVDQLKLRGCGVTYAVRSAPILNDATMVDAREVGMDCVCEVVESGSDAPGTVLSRVSPAFRGRMESSDVLLSKGQGNFESLFGEWEDVFFAFKVKCRNVEKISGLPLGSSVFRWAGGEGGGLC